MFKVNDWVKYKGSLGRIVEKKVVKTPSFIQDITLCKVCYEDNFCEWINVIYLQKGLK